MRKSNLDSFTNEEIKNIIQTSNTLSDVLRKFGYNPNNNGPRSTIVNYAIKHGLQEEINALKQRSKEQNKQFMFNLHALNQRDIDSILTESSTVTQKVLRERIKKDNLLEYKCAICGNTGEYNCKPLSLQLDHINGINNDNRLENLRWLCPNCHSQTDTFTSKDPNKQKELKALKKIEQTKKQFLVEERKKYFDNIDTTKYGWLAQAERDLGISHTQIRRWLKKYYPEKL